MKLIKVVPETGSVPAEFTFVLGDSEKRLLGSILDLYPLLNSDFHQLSRGPLPENRRADAEWLKESMLEHRRGFRKQLDVFLHRPCWQNAGPLILNEIEIGWLLQVLNDIRVGSWTLLGRPSDTFDFPDRADVATLRHFTAMEVSGHWQSYFLGVLERVIPPES